MRTWCVYNLCLQLLSLNVNHAATISSISNVSSMEIDANDVNHDEFLKQYHDCFSDSLPDELPPVRGVDDHRIDLVPGSAPTNKPPYRVS